MTTHWCLSLDSRVEISEELFRFMSTSMILSWNLIITREVTLNGTTLVFPTLKQVRTIDSILSIWLSPTLFTITAWGLWCTLTPLRRKREEAGSGQGLISATTKTQWKERTRDTTTLWHGNAHLSTIKIQFTCLIVTRTLTPTCKGTWMLLRLTQNEKIGWGEESYAKRSQVTIAIYLLLLRSRVTMRQLRIGKVSAYLQGCILVRQELVGWWKESLITWQGHHLTQRSSEIISYSKLCRSWTPTVSSTETPGAI